MVKLKEKLWQLGLFGFVAIPLPVLAIPDHHVATVVKHLEGVMDASVQAASKERISVRMTTCRVSLADRSTTEKGNSSDSVYLYQEQALAESLDSPYRQRFLAISTGKGEDTVISQSYKPINPQQWTGFCDRPESERVVKSEEVTNPICSVVLEPRLSIYVGQTPSAGCPTKARGAVKITNLIILHNQGMDTWDRGFDAEGNQVWGAQNQSYQFRWAD